MRLPKIQSILLLLLPILLFAILAFAKSGERFLSPLTVSSDGNTLIYWGLENDPSVGLQLFRDEGGVVSSIDFPPNGLHGFSRVIATPKWIVVFQGDKVYFVDPADFSKVEERSFFETPAVVTGLVLSGNQRYLFYSASFKQSTNPYRTGIIDLSNFELIWQHDGTLLDSDIAYGVAQDSWYSLDATIAVGNLIDVYSRDDAGNVITEAMEFEGGKPVRFALGGRPGKPNAGTASVPFWNRDRSVSIDTVGVQIIATNHENDKTQVLGQLRDSIYIVAQSDNTILLSRGGEPNLFLFDLASFEIGKTIPHVGDYHSRSAAISSDGKTIARLVTTISVSWAEYVRAECGFRQEYIEVLDANTGQQIRICEDKRSFWLSAALAFGGTIAWTVVWLRSSWQFNDSIKAISDITVIGLLWLSFFLLRYVFGGHLSGSPGSSDAARPAECGFMCLMTSLTALISIWSVSSQLRLSFRIPVGLIAIGALWTLPLALWQIYELPNYGIRFECLFVAVGVGLCCFVARLFGWAIGKPESDRQLQPNRGIKIKLSDMFLWPVAIVVLITVFPPLMKDVAEDKLLFAATIGLWISVITMSAFWAALSRYSKLKWIFGILFLLTLIVSISRFYFWHESAYIVEKTMITGVENFQLFLWRLAAFSAGVGLCSLLMMCWVRRQGWRWSKVNRQRSREAATNTSLGST